MKMLVRIALGLLALVVVVAIGLAVAVAVLFEPKDYQPLLVQAVQKSTGRTFTLQGELGLKLLPCCGIALGGATLGNPPGFPQTPFATVEKAALSLRIWPLLARREVEVGSVTLEGLNMALLRRADGQANWEFGADEAAAGDAAAVEEATSGELRVAGIRIRDGRLSYRDEQEKSAYTAEDITVETGAISPAQPFDIEASLALTDDADGTSAKLRLKSAATAAADGAQVTLTRPLLEVTAAGPQVPAKDLQATFGAKSLAVDVRQSTRFAFENLEGDVTLRGLETPQGDLDGSFATDTAQLELGPSTEFAAPAMSIDLEIRGAGIPGNTLTTTGKLENLEVDLDKLRGGVGSMQLNVAGLGAGLVATGGGRFSEAGAEMKGSLQLDPLSPRSLLAVLNEPAPETADPKALTRLSGTADWILKKDGAALEKLDFELDQTRINGRAGLRGFDAPTTTFDLQLDAIDLDRYLEPDSAAGGADGGGSATDQPTEIPAETLRGLRLDGRIAIGQLTLAKAKLADVNAGIRAADGRLRLEPLTAKLYEGEYRGAVMIDATGERAQVRAEQRLTGVQVGGVLRDLYQTDKLTGALTGRIDASGTGRTDAELLGGLAGSVSLDLADGVYQGMDLWHEIRNARARLRGNPPLPPPAQPQTLIKALELNGSITDGVLRSDRLLAEIPFLRVTGGGSLDLTTDTIDYALRAQVFETPVFADGGNLDDLAGLTIPFTVKGAMDGPKVSVDLKNLAKDVAIQKGKQRLLEKLGLGTPDGAATGLPDTAQPGEQPPDSQPPPAEKPRDALKRSLRDLLKQ